MKPPKRAVPPAVGRGGGGGRTGGGGSDGKFSPPRKSRRSRNLPTRYVARPSRQGFGVEEGDRAFLAFGRAEPVRKSKRLRVRMEENEEKEEGGRGRGRGRPSPPAGNGHVWAGAGKVSDPAEPKRPPAGLDVSPPKAHRKRRVMVEAPRPPRVIVIGAGISGLACARELSQRRHDVLVLEARNRIGGRLRTVDLMLDKEWRDDGSESRSDLFRVRDWSPVDVGGAFIHGTGFSTSDAPSSHVGSHDFGTSGMGRTGKVQTRKSAKQQQSPVRKSERIQAGDHALKQPPKINETPSIAVDNGRRNVVVRRSDDGIGSLNPVYVLARQKMRLPVHPAEGAYTCLVDHNGELVSDEVDREVAEDFNEVLDLATKCCDEGKYEWKDERGERGEEGFVRNSAGWEEQANSASHSNNKPRPKSIGGKDSVSTHDKGDASHSPNYVSDDTASNTIPIGNPSPGNAAGAAAAERAEIDPATDFGTIFDECKKHHDEVSNKARGNGSNSGSSSAGARGGCQRSVAAKCESDEVRKNLFRWHVANLEMSSGAPLSKLGQKWNDDEPFGYGGDHSYLEGGLRDIVEALAEGFDCRGVGDRSIAPTGSRSVGSLRRSGDFASTFSRNVESGQYPDGPGASPRGVIQCGIEVTGVRIVEGEDARRLRRQRKRSSAPVDDLSLRRSNRENRGSKMTSFLDALSSSRPRAPAEPPMPPETPPGEVSPAAATACYGGEQSTVVRVTTKCGRTLEADAVVMTTPLAILAIPPGSPGHIAFSPPLPRRKAQALNRLGVGAYNKCCMSFDKPFWNNLPRYMSTPGSWNDGMTKRFDFIGHASAEHGKDILFFSMRNVPVLVAIYGGSDYSERVEEMHDELVVLECMKVLKKICSSAIKARHESMKTRRQVDFYVPNWPIDYFVSRWGSDPYSRGAFCYVPPGVDGFEELAAMSAPIRDFRPERPLGKAGAERGAGLPRPLIMFAGEATTPYHPSTIHGAFESGIREAYRLDLALAPEYNDLDFDEAFLYQPTFSVRRAQADSKSALRGIAGGPSRPGRNGSKGNANTKSWWFDHDASILRGVESFGLSLEAMSKVKLKLLTPTGNTHSAEEMKDRYMSLMNMIVNTDSLRKPCGVGNEWSLPGGRGTWLAPGVEQGSGGNASNQSVDGKAGKRLH